MTVAELFSERAKMAGTGPVGLDPTWVRQMIAFGGGFPDPGSFPIHDLIDSARIALERDGEWALQYAFGSGVPQIVEQLRRKLERDQGIQAGVENILVTNGASQGLALIFELFLNPGDVMLSESPFFLGAVQTAHANGAEVVEIPLDGEGIVISELRGALERLRSEGRRAKFLYLVPTFQNPTGITYSLERRRELVALSEEFGLPIVEDDAYFDLRYDGQKIPTLYELANNNGLVMYVGTFSKILAAGMRLGWVVASAEIVSHLSGLKDDSGTSPFSSHIAAEFAASGTLLEHIGQLKSLYRSRRDAMLGALEASMPAGVSWTRPDGGFFIWVSLPEGVTCADVSARSRERGVSVGLGSMFFANGAGNDRIRLAYSFNTEDEISRGVAVLGEVIADLAS
jgi:DNA-binding transcriptional MocR family regulator